MALTARHAHLGVLDVTEFVAGQPAAWWHVVHRTKAPLTCRACGAVMDAVHAPQHRHRPFYFRHRAVSDCWLSAGESVEHHQLKGLLAGLVRAVPGWAAALEVSGDNWRADVLATGPGGRRIAFEAQLAAVSARDLRDRSETYAAAGVEVCWVTTQRRGWFGAAPSLLLELGSTGDWMVVDGARALPRQPLAGLHARRADPTSNASGKPFLVARPQTPAWTWEAILAAGGVPERLASTRQPWRFGLWLQRRAKVAWRSGKPVPLSVVVASILHGRTVPVALNGPCLDFGKPRLATAWVRRTDANMAAPLIAFAYGWPVVPAPTAPHALAVPASARSYCTAAPVGSCPCVRTATGRCTNSLRSSHLSNMRTSATTRRRSSLLRCPRAAWCARHGCAEMHRSRCGWCGDSSPPRQSRCATTYPPRQADATSLPQPTGQRRQCRSRSTVAGRSASGRRCAR